MNNKGQNLIICIDASISMNDRFGHVTKIDAVNDGVEMMLPHLSRQQGTMIGLVGYNSRPFVIRPLTFPNNRSLCGKVKSIRVGGYTNLLGGIDLACNLLIKRPRCFSRRVIALTDGHHNSGSITMNQLITKAKANRIVLDTIGIGNEGAFNKNLLMSLSGQTFGEFIAVRDLPKLLASFRKLSRPKPFKPVAGNTGGRSKGNGDIINKVIPFNLFRRRRF